MLLGSDESLFFGNSVTRASLQSPGITFVLIDKLYKFYLVQVLESKRDYSAEPLAYNMQTEV